MLHVLFDIKICPVCNSLKFFPAKGKIIFKIPRIKGVMAFFSAELLSYPEFFCICSQGDEPFVLNSKPVSVPLRFYYFFLNNLLNLHFFSTFLFFLHFC